MAARAMPYFAQGLPQILKTETRLPCSLVFKRCAPLKKADVWRLF